jgi:hypothetical protein
MMQKEKAVKEETVEEEERRKRRGEEAKKEESKLKVSERVEKGAKIKGDSTLPLIKLEKASELELKKLEVSKEIPQIKKRKITVSIPIIKLQEPFLMLKGYELDYKLPHVEKRRRLLTTPIIRVNSFPKTSILLTKFDSEIRIPPPKPPKIKVPIYQKGAAISPKFLLKTFDSTVDIPPPLDEIPDFLEFAFGSEGGKIRARGPKIILFKDLEGDSYINFLENVCLRIYREMEGGEPKAVKIRKLDDMNKREVEKWLEAGGKIFTIDMEAVKAMKDEDKDTKDYEMLDEDHLQERLEETYSEKLGFIIFTVREKEKFECLRRLLQKINMKTQGRLNIIELEARKLPLKLIELSSGMISLEEIRELIEKGVKVKVEKVPIPSFDFIFNKALFREDSLFNEALEKIKKEEKGLFRESTNPGKETESPLHFNIKVFLVRYLVDKLRKEGEELSTREEIMEKIKTEEKLAEEVEVIPDVKVGSEVYEVETLFGPHAGGEPDLKINKTVNKYDKVYNKVSPNITKVNIVMDNFCFLLHLKELLEKREKFKDKKFGVEFYTLDLQNKKLKSILDFAKEIKTLIKG